MTYLIYVTYALTAMSLVRLIIGPNLYDRLLALNMVSAHVTLLMAFYAVHYGHSFYLDVALIYALLSFTEIIAYVRLIGPNYSEGVVSS